MEEIKNLLKTRLEKIPRLIQYICLLLCSEVCIFLVFFLLKTYFELELLSDSIYISEFLSYFLILIFVIISYRKGIRNTWKKIQWEQIFIEGIMLVIIIFAFLSLTLSLTLTSADIGSAGLQNSLVLSIALFSAYAFLLNMFFESKETKKRTVIKHIKLLFGIILFLIICYYPLGFGLDSSIMDPSFEEILSIPIMFFALLIVLIIILLYREVIRRTSEKKANPLEKK